MPDRPPRRPPSIYPWGGFPRTHHTSTWNRFGLRKALVVTYCDKGWQVSSSLHDSNAVQSTNDSKKVENSTCSTSNTTAQQQHQERITYNTKRRSPTEIHEDASVVLRQGARVAIMAVKSISYSVETWWSPPPARTLSEGNSIFFSSSTHTIVSIGTYNSLSKKWPSAPSRRVQ